MASQSSTSSVFTGVLMAGIVIAGAAAIYLFVNQSNLPSAEQNTLAQAQGPLPPPARLRTLAQPAQQMDPGTPPAGEAQTDASQPDASGLVQPGQAGSPQQTVNRRAPVAPNNGGYDEAYEDDGPNTNDDVVQIGNEDRGGRGEDFAGGRDR